MILQETFWDNALILERLLQPIKETLKLVEAQSDMSLGQIKHSLVLIAKDIMSYMKQVVITMEEQTSIECFLKESLKRGSTILHVASNIIDPRYQGRDLEEGEFTNGVEYMCKMVKVLQIGEENELLQNLSRYRLREREWQSDYLWSTPIENPRMWWSSKCGPSVLNKLACTMLSLRSNNCPEDSKPSCLDKNIVEKVEFIAFNSRSLK